MAVQKKKDISFNVLLPIALDASFSIIKYSSFSKGYHVYKVWRQPTVGDDSLHCKEEKANEYDKDAVAIIYNDFHSNKVVGYVPHYWSESANIFLKFPNHHILLLLLAKEWTEALV